MALYPLSRTGRGRVARLLDDRLGPIGLASDARLLLYDMGQLHNKRETPAGANEPQGTLTPLGLEFLKYLVANNYNIFERPN